jgi:hypothetical protein
VHVRYSVAGRSGSRVTPCVVYIVHMETGSTDFLVERQNLQLQFGNLDLKIIAMVSLFVPQNQADICLSVAPQNRWRSARDTHRDIVACFGAKQVWLGFPSLASRLMDA